MVTSPAPSATFVWDGAPVATWANLVTTVRTAGAVVLGVVGLLEASELLLAIAYGVYWVGDSLDGNVARWTGGETRLGAVYDIVSDRACSAVLIGGLLVVRPDFAPALVIYLLQFMVIDMMLSLGFLHWPLVSPNYFHRVDRVLWRWNWSVPAKTANTTLLLVLLLVAPVAVATVVAVVQLAVKVWSAHRMLTIAAAGQTCSPD
ncbi:CDP-alcohol phosphatidyltransferase [Aeromicrobium marinum DSM 15272]|uniref:CDP-alcohol phosphatidyltransferase n=1 Tax=Aeromicrobium marinum DSM 15272 TaxID=585531 RepID=E2SFY0_9ACTN|nr:CDP-alcohol phosphatidyltransferase family protein [Aeromicrobium marinum]EFQ81927.1 CDP-alcohol phosphatidyltransferase [Aeromicrobium marinum DSM 15272]